MGSPVLSNNSQSSTQTKKSFKKTLPKTLFLLVFDLGPFLEESFFRLLRKRETVMLL